MASKTIPNDSWCDPNENGTATVTGVLLRACDCHLPQWMCAGANVAGLCSTALWFLVLVPQVYRSYRRRSVEGVSVAWAIANFTAALNNSFFVFKVPFELPWYSRVSAVYMPVLEALLLVEFWCFTVNSTKKTIVAAICIVFWVAIVLLQSLFDVYNVLEWLSVTLWGIETFPQLFLNMQRRSTVGLSNEMVTIATIGKTTDFINTYILILPPQYLIMAYFSSSTAIIGTIQVLLYWNRRPPIENNPDTPTSSTDEEATKTTVPPAAVESVRDPISPGCQTLRLCGMALLGLEVALVFNVALWLRTHLWELLWPAWIWLVFPPVGVYGAILVRYLVLQL